MNVVGRVGSLISQGVYSVAMPFHPFGGAVDVIVVEQQDGTYRSTPWYVRFGKFQGVLKGAEKIVRISVNGIEANFHMQLDNSGKAYFVREVVSSKDSSRTDDGVENSDESAVAVGDDGDWSSANRLDSNNGFNGNAASHIRNVSDISNVNDEIPFSDDGRVSISSKYEVENGEAGNGRSLYEFGDNQSSDVDSVGSSGYRGYGYESLDQLEDVVESNGSDSEMVIVSVDGHVLTAPFSSSEENTKNVQLSTPQFHLGPGEEAEFSGGSGEFSNGQETWAAEYFSKLDGDLVTHSLENIDDAKKDIGEQHDSDTPVPITDSKDIFKSCQDFNLHVEDDAESQEPCVEPEEKDTLVVSQENSHNLSIAEEYVAGREENISELPCNSSKLPRSDKSHDSLSVGVEDLNNNWLTMNNSNCENTDEVSLHSDDDEQHMKDKQNDGTLEPKEVESTSGRSIPEIDHSKFVAVESETPTNCACVKSNQGLGFEISLCGNLLHCGMGLDHANEAFDAHRISEDEFKTSAFTIVKNENLVVRYKSRFYQWEKAAPIILGKAAFDLDLPIELDDAISVQEDAASNLIVEPPALTPASGRRWRLWPIPFRRVKTLQHTNSTASNEDIFVDSESAFQSSELQEPSTPHAGNESPRKQFMRTNVPTTEQVASLNLKDGQNMITFSFSTRVLGTQQVDAHIYLWKWNARIVISDVDGTITKSDVLGQFMPLVGKDWTQSGVAHLFSAIKENGYQLLFLSARAIVQAYLTRSFLLNLKQDGKNLPSGPVVISPDGLFPALYREVIRRAPHEFKIACLEDIKALFPSDYNPFYAGFGNRDTDELSYRKIGIPKGKIFIINPKGEVAINHRIDVKSYTSLHTLVNDMFPPTSMVEQEDFNSWNYWKMPLPNIDM
ncbi:hypothetical protein Scep_004508 [Stephania cephalantha]|uniref:phosphatidate phosphatase n=1 Tax=Stephania cephalantha TaxID=152367 RepID=A0AAP0KVG2_9MAGN